MKRLQAMIVAAVCAAALTGSATAFSQVSINRIPRPGHQSQHRLTPQEKSASDQAMRNGLAALQAAGSAMQSNNAQGVGNSLIAARNAMQQALPIYDGHRERAIKATDEALKEMRGTGTAAGRRVATHLGEALQDAQAALQVR